MTAARPSTKLTARRTRRPRCHDRHHAASRARAQGTGAICFARSTQPSPRGRAAQLELPRCHQARAPSPRRPVVRLIRRRAAAPTTSDRIGGRPHEARIAKDHAARGEGLVAGGARRARPHGKVASCGRGQTPGTIGNGRPRFRREARGSSWTQPRRETVAIDREEGGTAPSATSPRDCAAAGLVARSGHVLHNNVGIGGGDASPTHLEEDGGTASLTSSKGRFLLQDGCRDARAGAA